jgi:hypothetical protein
MALVTGLVLSFLPEAWRRRWFPTAVANVEGGALASGLLQLALCAIALVIRFPGFVRSQLTDPVSAAMLGGAEKGGETMVMGFGPVLLVAYIIQPLTLLLLYFLFEGALRTGAAIATNEALPTAPLFLLSLLDGRARAYRRERALGPRTVDQVQFGRDGTLTIASCREKSWTRLATIRHEDKLYELARAEQGVKPRQFLYHLRAIPPEKLLRGVHDYSPDEALREKERGQAAAAPSD